MYGYRYGYGGPRRQKPPSLPPGFAYVVDADGAYLVDADGAYLITEI